MENKKNNKADLHGKRGIFFQIGLIVTLLILLLVFEWSTPDIDEIDENQIVGIDIEMDMLPVVRQEKLKPPLPKPQAIEEMIVVDDDIELDEELEVGDNEIDEQTPILMPDLPQETEEIVPLWLPTLEKKPQFGSGGEKGLQRYIAKQIHYPVQAIENDIQGRVYVRFVVTRKGKVDKASIIKGVHPLIDKEALRIIQSLPEWKPGVQNGKPIDVWYTIPVTFMIE